MSGRAAHPGHARDRRTDPSRTGAGRLARRAGAAWLVAGFCVTLPLTVQLFRYGDEWWHIALGRLILSHGIPGVEPFSFVATQHPWWSSSGCTR